MNAPSIQRAAEEAEHFISEGCYILELSNSPGDEAVSIARALCDPAGQGTRRDRRSRAQEVGPGDVVLIPATCRQRITNLEEGELVFLAICHPRFRKENYEALIGL